MKTTNQFFYAIVVMLLFLSVSSVSSQEEKTARYYTVTKMNFNMDNDSDANWLDVEKEYLDKVTKKNDYIMNAGFYTHLYTENSTDVIYVQVFSSWEDINKAAARNGELEKEAWPDDTARAAFIQVNILMKFTPFWEDQKIVVKPQQTIGYFM